MILLSLSLSNLKRTLGTKCLFVSEKSSLKCNLLLLLFQAQLPPIHGQKLGAGPRGEGGQVGGQS